MNPDVLPVDLDQEAFWFCYWLGVMIEGCVYSYLFERIV